MTATSTILERAADVIERKGWIRATGWADAEKPDAPCCLEGALMWASDEQYRLTGGRMGNESVFPLVERMDAYQAVVTYLQGHGVLTSDQLYEWNDRKNRTAEEVIQLLRDVATVERQKGN